MKYLFSIFIIVFFTYCKNKETKNEFDEIIHYQITDDKVSLNIKNDYFEEIFSSTNGHELNITKFETEIESFGYEKRNIEKSKLNKIDIFLSNEIYYDAHLVACIPSYRDILILKKNKKTIAVLKICFECTMNEIVYGSIETNFNEDKLKSDNYFSSFNVLYSYLYDKEYNVKK